MAERYLYIGTVFFCMTVALILESVGKKTKLYALFLGLILTGYSIKTFWRNGEWLNNKALWTSTQKVAKYSYRVYNNLGDVAATEGNLDEAIKYFQISLQLNPQFADAVHNLGFIYYQKGDKEMAKQYLAKSLEMNPYLFQSAFKLGVIAYEQGDLTAAKNYFIKTLELSPDYAYAKKALQTVIQVEQQSASSAPASN